MATKKKRKVKIEQQEPQATRSVIVRPLYIILLFVLTSFVLAGVFISQQSQLRSIATEKEALQIQLDDRKIEKERLERMLEYMQTDEYLIQYAREKLGYVFPDDWKFYEDTTGNTAP